MGDPFDDFIKRRTKKKSPVSTATATTVAGDISSRLPTPSIDVERAFERPVPLGRGFSTPDETLAGEFFPGALGQDPDRLGQILGETEQQRNVRLETERENRGIAIPPFMIPLNASLREINDILQDFLRTTTPPREAGFLALPGAVLDFFQEEAETNVALARSAIPRTVFGKEVPSAFQGTGERAAELREAGLSTFEAAKQAAKEDPLPTLQIPFPLTPEGVQVLLAHDISIEDIAEIQQTQTIGLPTQILAEIAFDYLNLLVILGPAVRASRVGLEFAEAATRSGLREAGESLPQFARRLAKPVQEERRLLSLPPGKDSADYQRAINEGIEARESLPQLGRRLPKPVEEERELLSLPPGKDPSDYQLAIKEGRELQVGTPASNVPTTASGVMPPEQADDIIEWFGNLIASPESIEGHVRTQKLRRAARAERATNFQRVLNQLLDEGLDPEEAYHIALREMGGELPSVNTGFAALATEDVKNALIAKVQNDLADEPLEQMNTMTALQNAMFPPPGRIGKPIPRTKGTTGRSAFTRLQRIFPQEIVDALDGQTVDDLVSILMAKAPQTLTLSRLPIGPDRPAIQGAFGESPVEAEQLTLINPVGDPLRPGEPPTSETVRPPGKFGGPIGSEPADPRNISPDPSSTAKKVTDLEAFATAIEGKVPEERVGETAVEVFDQTVIGQIALMPVEDRNLILQTLQNMGMTAMDAGNFLRANLASFDLSWMRQQAFLILGNPMEFGPAIADSLRAAWTREFADSVMSNIQNTKLFAIYDKIGGDFLRPLSGEVGMLYQAAEDFMALSVVKGETPRFFQRLAENTPWIRISARAHVIGTNSMNWRIFENHYQSMLRVSDEIARGQIKLKVGEVFSIETEMKAFANMLAEMSGRGPLGPLKSLSPAMNAGFFSMRLMIGRLLSPLQLTRLRGTTKYSRRAAWKNFTTAIGGMTAIIMAGKQMGLWDVETDRRSADFMKIRIGKTRIDIWGGYQQFAVLYGRLLQETPSLKSTETGLISEQDPLALTGRFLRSKMHPALSNVLELWVQEDFIGRDIDRKDWLRWIRRNLPLAAVDIYEAFDGEGLVGIILGSTGVLGAGVQTYDLPRWPELDKYYSFSRDHPNETPAEIRARKANFRLNPNNEARLFVRGHIETLTTTAAGRIVMDLMRKHKISPKEVPSFEKVFKVTELPPERREAERLIEEPGRVGVAP